MGKTIKYENIKNTGLVTSINLRSLMDTLERMLNTTIGFSR
jgi:hypothetical protein